MTNNIRFTFSDGDTMRAAYKKVLSKTIRTDDTQ